MKKWKQILIILLLSAVLGYGGGFIFDYINKQQDKEAVDRVLKMTPEQLKEHGVKEIIKL